MTVKEAIKEIIKLRGLLIFNDYNKFIALLLDLGNSNQKELNIFKSAVNEKILKLCIDDSIENSQKITKIKIRLEDNGFSENTINFVIDSLVFALGWNYMKNQDVLNQTGWTCSCGTINTGNFCSNCGSAKPQPKESKDWTCSCGTVNAGNFCSNCGKAKPVTNESKDWTCSCGTVNAGNFCSNCGNKKGQQKIKKIRKTNKIKSNTAQNYIEVILNETVLNQLGYDTKYNPYYNDFGITNLISFQKNGQNITILDIPATYIYNAKKYKITEIGNGVFSNCNSLITIRIPSSIIKIGKLAFNRCLSLTSVIIPESVTQIGMCAFCDCESLNSIIIPSSVTKIEDYAFLGLKHIEYHGTASGAPWGAKSMN